MAYEVVMPNSTFRAKHRNPWGVLGLSLVTLGIYTPMQITLTCAASKVGETGTGASQ